MNLQRKINHFLLGQITKMKFFLDVNDFVANGNNSPSSFNIKDKLDILARIIQYSWLVTDTDRDFDFNDSVNLYDIFSLNQQIIMATQKNRDLNILNTTELLTNKILFNDMVKFLFLFLYNKGIKDINYSSRQNSINIKTIDIISCPKNNKLIEILTLPNAGILEINYALLFELSKFLQYVIIIKDNNLSIFF